MSKRITYVDVNGKQKTLTFVEPVSGLVRWHRNKPPEPAAKWRMEDGYIVQIPQSAWDNVRIIKETTDE